MITFNLFRFSSQEIIDRGSFPHFETSQQVHHIHIQFRCSDEENASLENTCSKVEWVDQDQMAPLTNTSDYPAAMFDAFLARWQLCQPIKCDVLNIIIHILDKSVCICILQHSRFSILTSIYNIWWRQMNLKIIVWYPVNLGARSQNWRTIYGQYWLM